MKKISFLSTDPCFSGLLIAKVRPESVIAPFAKQTQIVKADTNSGKMQQIPPAAVIIRGLPATVNQNPALYKWKASRRFENSFCKGITSSPDFTFNDNRNFGCGSSIISAGGGIQTWIKVEINPQ